MKHKIKILAVLASYLILASLLFSLLFVSAQSSERVVNGGFEAGPLFGVPSGWSDVAGSTVSDDQVHSGDYSVVSYSDGAGLSQVFSPAIPVSSITSFSLWVNGYDEGTEQNCTVTFSDESSISVSLNPNVNIVWEEKDILSSLGAFSSKSIVSISLTSGTANPIFYDDVSILAPVPATSTPSPMPPTATPDISTLKSIVTYTAYGVTAGGFLALFAVILFAKKRRDGGK